MAFISKSTFAVALGLAFAILAFTNTSNVNESSETSFLRRLRRNAMYSPVKSVRGPEPFDKANKRRSNSKAYQASMARKQKRHEKLVKDKEFMEALQHLGDIAKEEQGVGEVGSDWYKEQAANIEREKANLGK
ncbi:predicted protein [Chaetoceros tenuissimus]|uniref:Uncharacterized protein n=1 Tax=Chaetoceros tenuissimus TaxID=426638 RepID=A0AAD3H1Z6_9STRA|nr:predicted protein [Chaetoceros tenuissimus]